MGYHENENQVKFIMLCKTKEKQKAIERELLGQKITYRQKRLDEANVTAMEKQKITEEIGIINLQRDEISEYKTKGAIIRKCD